ncbi:uncharacterized protein [Lepeophtheirus salmonis]|uniref:uncharacterized protein n=1 Tax=Lepeophtheirus salmonis TaxID=72036 RepID=UPI001AE740F9|nr:serine/arginine repetitive matrix protein 2-like [Lepeophtheirus salmonis]XP_040567482.1 serine/arginine repetitive matrix protein 2-like [Lepeophtheirus salmonis]XP_040567483.1 serine/arginine repetitive matrix protein 2-like [Lepeophtheirus salmonis]
MEGDEEEMVSSPELPYEPEDITDLDEEFGGRLSVVSNSSLNLDEEDDEDEILVLNNNKKKNGKDEDPDEDTEVIGLPPSHQGGYSPVSSEKRSETDVEEGEIFIPNMSRETKKKEEPLPLLQASTPKLPKHRKKRKKEPLDVEMSKHFSKHTDLLRYDVRNIIKFKKRKRSSTLSLRKPSSPRRPSSPPSTLNSRHYRRRRAHSSPEARSSPARERRNRRCRSREKVRPSNSKNRTSRSKDRRSRSRDKRSRSRELDRRSRSRELDRRSRSRELDRRSRSREKEEPHPVVTLKRKRKKGSAVPATTTTISNNNSVVSSSSPVKVLKSSKKTKKSLSEKKKASKKSSSSLVTPITIVNSHTSSVAAKEVFTAGDKIMVSVNFKPSRVKAPPPISMNDDEAILSPLQQHLHRNQNETNAANTSSNSLLNDSKKPVVIDVMSSPYLVIEPSPQETIDILSDEEGGGGVGGGGVASTNVVSSSGITNVICTVGSSSSSSSNNSCISSNSGGGGGGNTNNNPAAGVVSGSGGPPGGNGNIINPITSSSTTNGNGLSVSSSVPSSSNLAISSSPLSPPSPPQTPPLSSAPPTQSTATSSSSNAVPTAIIDILHHRGPCTPPIEESIDVAKGPQTPSDHSYDPCNPTLSPTCDEDLEPDDFQLRDNGVSSSQNNWTDSDEHSKEPAANSSIPFFDSGSFFSSNSAASTVAASSTLATTTTTSSFSLEKTHKDSSKELDITGAKDYSTVDMDMDSPFSPQSSDMSDIFEPPLNTPLTNKLLQKRSKSKFNKLSASKKPSTSSISNYNNNNNNNVNNNNKTSSKNLHSKSVQMKLIDDKLRIVDDVPTSAVEMAVKEKFLKKVQRQERIVEEIKMVLKPYYNRKKIDKEAYKDILRKCVPKVCHSKNGEINPIKIQKLVKGYIRKYKYNCKKNNKAIKG